MQDVRWDSLVTGKFYRETNSMDALVPVAPQLSEKTVKTIVEADYALSPTSVSTLPGWADKNYLIKTLPSNEDPSTEKRFVFKLMNSKESKQPDYIDDQDAAMLHLHQHGFICSVPISNKWGTFHRLYNPSLDTDASGKAETGGYLVRLLSYVHGQGLDTRATEITNNLLYSTGRFIASVDSCLQKWNHKDRFGFQNQSIWNLENCLNLREMLPGMDTCLDQVLMERVTDVLNVFEAKVISNFHLFQRGLIHGDCNPENIVLLNETSYTKDSTGKDLFGIIDFGDMSYSFIVFELAIAICHMVVFLQEQNVSMRLAELTEGYTSIFPLSPTELSALEYCVAARLAQLVVLSTYYCNSNNMDTGADKLLKQSKAALLNMKL